MAVAPGHGLSQPLAAVTTNVHRVLSDNPLNACGHRWCAERSGAHRVAPPGAGWVAAGAETAANPAPSVFNVEDPAG
jgi:hypothetical protein